MSREPHSFSPIFHIDVSTDSREVDVRDHGDLEVRTLLRRLVEGQERQNKLLEEVSQQLGASQRQRATELGQWKEANPRLANGCRVAAEALSRVQSQFLENLTEEVNENADVLMDGEFMLNEFVDRFGPRLAHLNGVLQVLSQLGAAHNAPGAATP
jgi:hypothetical protein